MTKDSLNTYYDELGATLGETLLAPTRIYVKALRAIKDAGVTVKHAATSPEAASTRTFRVCSKTTP